MTSGIATQNFVKQRSRVSSLIMFYNADLTDVEFLGNRYLEIRSITEGLYLIEMSNQQYGFFPRLHASNWHYLLYLSSSKGLNLQTSIILQ